MFTEPGPAVTQAEWSTLVDGIPELLTTSGATVLVLSGSLPRGVPDDAHAELVVLARDHGALTIVDAEGTSLWQAVAAHPDVVKPNLTELAAATGEYDPAAGVEVLRRHGALDVVVSAGPDGVVVLPRDGGQLTARLRTPLSGNPTGAGDAMVAALAARLARAAGAVPDWSTTTRGGRVVGCRRPAAAGG